MEALRRTIGGVIRQCRTAQGMSLEALAERAGCAKSYLSEIENGRRAAPPSAGLLGRIEAALGLSGGTLVEMAAWERTPGQVRRRVTELETREKVVRKLVDLVELLTNEREGREARVGCVNASRGAGQRTLVAALPFEAPVIHPAASGGAGAFTNDKRPARVADEYVRSVDVDDPDAFAVRVAGESMMPDYRERDIVIFSPLRAVRSGMDCFVRLERDQEFAFARVFFQASPDAGMMDVQAASGEWVRLQPLNPAFPVRVVHRNAVDGMYAAVSVTRALR